ncbi:flagellar brake domain-containing protein [Clostridium sp. JN-1]|uniref:flagellar brake protein n=1 Tax=Clostridium sp. JN-1 TaxID=2483110 RepID=UPI000F0B10C7|nr:flagellar brake domain-containing protein [Clostridium sp. JN-1]
MKRKVDFIVNSKIEIQVENKTYKSNIQDVTDDSIGISIPVNNGEYLPLRGNEKINVLYYCNKDIYGFETRVIGRKVENIQMILIQKPYQFKTIQRRNFVRVNVMINVRCIFINNEKYMQNINDNQVKIFEGYTLDMSGGGMRIAFDRSLEKNLRYGSILMIEVPFQTKNFVLKSKIVRIENDKKNPKIICGVNFIDLDKVTREHVIRMVFRTMRDQMKNGAREE